MNEPSFFAPEEFLCRCQRPECDAPTAVSPDLLARLNILRMRVGRPLRVTSGLRCGFWNAKVSGVGDSEHLTGEAADLAVANGAERFALLAAVFAGGASSLFNRVGVGGTFIHLGVNRTLPQQVMWTYPTSASA